MRSLATTLAGTVLALTHLAAALRPEVLPPPPLAPPLKLDEGGSRTQSPAPAAISQATIDQLIDHQDPDKGTFKMRYWYNPQFYKPGGPVIVFTPGESSADGYTGYLGNNSLTGYLASELGGLPVVVEHRYWGESHPFDDLSVENLKYLTINQSVTDFAYFAQNVKFDVANISDTDPLKTPWIFVGGSYSGNIAAYLKAAFGDLFWVAYATSAPVEAVIDYWSYQVPIQQGLPKNCTSDLAAVIEHVDDLLINGKDEDFEDLKKTFGLEGLDHKDDFASALTLFPSRWQGQQADSGYAEPHIFCDAIEVQDGKASDDGVGLDKALPAWGKYMADNWKSACGSDDVHECFDSYDTNQSYYTDISFNNDYRQWQWFTCTTFGYWQNGAPKDQTTIYSRLITSDYWYHQCDLMFPGYDRNDPGPDYVNKNYQGWDIKSNKLWFTNAGLDPWREASVSSDFGPKPESTDDQPIAIIKEGIHCWDLLVRNWINEDIPGIVHDARDKIKGWLGEFKPAEEEAAPEPEKRTRFSRWL